MKANTTAKEITNHAAKNLERFSASSIDAIQFGIDSGNFQEHLLRITLIFKSQAAVLLSAQIVVIAQHDNLVLF